MTNLWQSHQWQKFQESLGRKIWRLEAHHASALIIRHQLPLSLCWLEIPRGPTAEGGHPVDKLMEEVAKLAKKEKAVFVRLSPYDEIRNSIPKRVRDEIRNCLHDHHPQTTLLLDLSMGEEEILKQMKPKGRYNIKVAQKNGVTIHETNDVAAFHRILIKTASRDGFSVNPRAYYEKMLQSLHPHAQLLVAQKDGVTIAGGLFVYLGDTAIYYYGASDNERRNLMAPYLVQWTAIREAKRRGCKTYDFLGIAPEDAKNHPWAGVTDFKKKFGGAIVNYPQAQELVIRPFWYWAYRIYKKLRG